ncbi:MAG: hypothetical protein KDA78_18375, partial [Planctomycetaceae bacterium]|nr:hypothetical protein [Planctomycetaceae bacterium]
ARQLGRGELTAISHRKNRITSCDCPAYVSVSYGIVYSKEYVTLSLLVMLCGWLVYGKIMLTAAVFAIAVLLLVDLSLRSLQHVSMLRSTSLLHGVRRRLAVSEGRLQIEEREWELKQVVWCAERVPGKPKYLMHFYVNWHLNPFHVEIKESEYNEWERSLTGARHTDCVFSVMNLDIAAYACSILFSIVFYLFLRNTLDQRLVFPGIESASVSIAVFSLALLEYPNVETIVLDYT